MASNSTKSRSRALALADEALSLALPWMQCTVQSNHEMERRLQGAKAQVRQALAAIRSMPSETERSGAFVRMPAELHPDTQDLVRRFAEALAEKLHAAEKKYGYDNGWTYDGWRVECARKLRDHIKKGDPRDVAAFCAFMWHHGWSTRDAAPVDPRDVMPSAGRP